AIFSSPPALGPTCKENRNRRPPITRRIRSRSAGSLCAGDLLVPGVRATDCRHLLSRVAPANQTLHLTTAASWFLEVQRLTRRCTRPRRTKLTERSKLVCRRGG